MSFLVSCSNPLGDQDTRDSSFSPGGGETTDGGTSIDTEPPGAPSALAQSNTWATGNNPTTSPILTWVNPTDADFDHSEVALGVSIGGEEFVPFVESAGSSSHTFVSLSLTECSVLYYPSVKALDASNNESSVVSFTSGFRYDNTNPVTVGAVNIPSNDASGTQSATSDWSASVGSDNCEISHYEIAIGYDDDADGFDTGDIENALAWSIVPGGSTATAYQVQDGVDGFSLSIDFNQAYYTTIRVVDAAGLKSTLTTSNPWYTFHPSQFTNLAIWLDSKATSSLFQDSGCSTTPATVASDPVGCWQDQSGNNNNAIQAVGASKPLIGTTGLNFDGSDDIFSIATKNYVTASDISVFAFYEAAIQSNAAGSCCRPIVSFATNSTGLYPWLGLTRGDYTPANNLFHGWSGGGLFNIPTSPGDQIIVSATHDGTNALWNAFSFGVQQVTNQAIASFTGTSFGVGGDPNNAARRVAGEIYEVVVVEDILSSTDREKMEAYLACKYDARNSLDPSHPYYDLVGANKTGCP